MNFGFTADNWKALAIALGAHGAENEVAKVRETGFGPRYEVEGPLAAPGGRRPWVRSVWQLDSGEIAPRLITAFPMEDKP